MTKGGRARGARSAARPKRRPQQARRQGRGGRGQRPKANGGWSTPGFRANGRAQVVQMGGGAAASKGMELCCALGDPWSPSCRGCKWPDGQNANSVPYPVRAMVSFNVNSTGQLAVALTPGLMLGYMAGTVAGTTITWPAGWQPWPYPAFVSNFQEYRPVCAGCRVAITSSVTNTSGELLITTHSNAPGNSTTQTFTAMDGLEVQSFPVATGKQFTVLFRPEGSGGRNYSGVAGQPSWSCIQLQLTGGSYTSATVGTQITVEFLMQLEGLFPINTGMDDLAPRDPPANPKAVALVQHVQAKLGDIHDTNPEGYGAKVKQATKAAATRVMHKGVNMAMDAALEGLAGLFAE
jgi:hypothetical protein